MTESRTYVIIGTSGMLAGALRQRLEGQGHRVVGVDVDTSAEVVADLSSADGRARMLRDVEALTEGRIDAVVAAAAMVGVFPDTALMVRTNYFGVLATLEGLRPLLARSPAPRAATFASVSLLRPAHSRSRRGVSERRRGSRRRGGGVGRRPAGGLHDDQAGAVAMAAPASRLGRLGREPHPSQRRRTGMTRRDDFEWDPESQFGRFMRELEPRPLHPVSRLDHVASLVDWLTSVDNGAMTGQILFVDGGTEALLRGDDLWSGYWPDPHPSAPMPDIQRN